MKVQFLGAARQVTGSCTLLEAGGARVLVDCGMFQERPYQNRNWEPSPVAPDSIDAVLLTHAHLDHCGLLPKLVKEGFRGPIYATRPTVELAEIVLEDAARIQQEDVEFKKRRHEKEGRRGPHPYEPIYTPGHVAETVARMRGVRYGEPVRPAGDLSVRFLDAGHILGSAMLETTARENGRERRILFSGDVGQWDVPIVGDPTLVEGADYVVLESTYGTRDHEEAADIDGQIADVVQDTLRRGGNVVIPTFALERAQEVLLRLGEGMLAGKIPGLLVFLDSPMAIDATEVFLKYPDFMDERARRTLESGRLDRVRKHLRVTRSIEESKAINRIRGTCVIMAGAGMCTGGRIKHHLAWNLHRPESTILFVGYQAQDTLGRQILDGASEVRLFGKMVPVRARIHQIRGLSAHAGHADLLRWTRGFRTPPRRLFVNHGEDPVAQAFAEELRSKSGWETAVPAYREEFVLD